LNPSNYVNTKPGAKQEAPVLRLAVVSVSLSLCTSIAPVSILVSYHYIRGFDKRRELLNIRDWSMDSGAFSAENSGAKIDINAYIETCAQRLAEDDQLTEVFSLDDISDWKKSRANTEKMWQAGVPCIPTFHWGEPWHVLEHYAKVYPKISIGGVVGKPKKQKDAWVAQVFARVWPKKIHGLGLSGEGLMMTMPFHSADASSWEFGPRRFATWRTFGRPLYGINEYTQQGNIQAEAEWYQKMEHRVRARWRNTWKGVGDV
jgi:hypothetical protein